MKLMQLTLIELKLRLRKKKIQACWINFLDLRLLPLCIPPKPLCLAIEAAQLCIFLVDLNRGLITAGSNNISTLIRTCITLIGIAGLKGPYIPYLL